tara:strand:- start:8257 stop:8715 length:459 start_codon:yes stop_codon:yes gene_type:complete
VGDGGGGGKGGGGSYSIGAGSKGKKPAETHTPTTQRATAIAPMATCTVIITAGATSMIADAKASLSSRAVTPTARGIAFFSNPLPSRRSSRVLVSLSLAPSDGSNMMLSSLSRRDGIEGLLRAVHNATHTATDPFIFCYAQMPYGNWCKVLG